MARKKGKSGPPVGNLNALKSGARIMKTRLIVGELPKQLLSVRREGRAYRRSLESAVLDGHQIISTMQAHCIDTASAATVHAGICRWLLRHKLAEMSTSDVLNCSKEMVKAKQARDAAVRCLDLDRPPANPWEIEVQAEVPADD